MRKTGLRRFEPMGWEEALNETERLLREAGPSIVTALSGSETVEQAYGLARLLRAYHVDLAHAYLFHPNVVAPIAARLAGVRATVVSKRSLDRYPSRFPRLAVKLGNALADRVMVNADAIGRFVAAEEGCPAAKMVLIPRFAPGPVRRRCGPAPISMGCLPAHRSPLA